MRRLAVLHSRKGLIRACAQARERVARPLICGPERERPSESSGSLVLCPGPDPRLETVLGPFPVIHSSDRMANLTAAPSSSDSLGRD